MSPKVLKGLCNDVEAILVSKLPLALAKEFNHLKSISNASATVLGESGDIEPGVLEIVLMCLRKGKVFECQYSSPDEKRFSNRKRSFASFKLHFVGAPYIDVYVYEDNEIKILRISRIHKPVKTEISVDKKRVKEINLNYVFGGYGKGAEAVIDYTVTCTKPLALRFQEHKIHPTQKIEILGDGDFLITFSVHDSDEVVRLLIQYGEFIKGIKPSSCYDRVKAIWSKGLSAA
jgi:predicted DNA-binding transcriptional regulator YafY